MPNVVLKIKREKAFTGAAVPFLILIDGKEVARVKNGGTVEVEAPTEKFTLKIDMYGNAATPNKITASADIDTTQCTSGVINCVVDTKINWIGYLTYGLGAPMANMEIRVNY